VIYLKYIQTLIYIPDEQAAPLTRICQQAHISRAEAIRRAIALFLEQHRDAGKDVFGLWKGRAIDGEEHQRMLRREWRE
jgi:hypothetical protein